MRLTTITLALTLLASLGCSDDDSSPAAPGGGGGGVSNDRTLAVSLTGMNPHADQLTVFSVVSDNDDLVSRVVVDPLTLTSGAFSFAVPSAVPDGAHRLDFFADLSGNRQYNAPPADHAWREQLPSTGTAAVTFTHNTSFTDISTPSIAEGGDFTINLSLMNPHVGQLFELRVIDSATGRTVGQYRLETLAAAESLEIPGIIVNGRDYRVDFYADLNRDGSYDAPPTDHAWRRTGTGTASGLAVDFTHDTQFTDIDF
jgi:hypothetical protein